MSNVRAAILRGTQAAARVHKKMGLRKDTDITQVGRIDVFDTMVKLDLPFLFKPLSTLLGVYLPYPTSGILITTKRPLSVQRFTGAHELGHYCLGHQHSLDSEEILHRSPFVANPNYDIRELEADAFAAELLIPRWLIAKQLLKQGWIANHIKQPEIVYQLSLRLGASYDATCLALERYKLIDSTTRNSLLSISPQEIKIALLRGRDTKPGWSDVWLLSEKDEGSVIEGSKTDLFVLRLREHSGAGYLWNFEQLDEANFAILKDERIAMQDVECGGDVTRWIEARSKASHTGELALSEKRPWLEDGESLSSLRFEYDLSGPETEGLSKAERKQLWSAA